MESFYKKNMPQVCEDVVAFYERHVIAQRDPVTGVLDVIICLDGMYAHQKESRQCTTIIAEPFTGSMFDYVVREKCFVCEDNMDFGSVCQKRLFHGASADMERENAVELFGRSEREHKLRYIEYVCDGDIKVVKDVNDSKPYGEDVVIRKTECANHLVKRSAAMLVMWGTEWTYEGFSKREVVRKRQEKKREDEKDKAERKAEKERKRKEKLEEMAKKWEERAKKQEERAKNRGRGRRVRKGYTWS